MLEESDLLFVLELFALFIIMSYTCIRRLTNALGHLILNLLFYCIPELNLASLFIRRVSFLDDKQILYILSGVTNKIAENALQVSLYYGLIKGDQFLGMLMCLTKF
jgi:hypothetical protein